MQQIALTLIGGFAQMPLWFAKPKRRKTVRAGIFAPWSQLTLKLPVRALVRKGHCFVWTRPDGRQFVCRNTRSLAARIRDYDGRMLKRLLNSAGKLISTPKKTRAA